MQISMRVFIFLQDGDFSTAWTCAAADLTGIECTLDFDLFSYRHIKQIKIGEPKKRDPGRRINMPETCIGR